jgi:hypothetical protein
MDRADNYQHTPSKDSRTKEAQPLPKLLYDRKSAAWSTSLSIRTIDYFIAEGAFETRRIGRKVLITAASLKKFAAANHFGPVSGTSEEEVA